MNGFFGIGGQPDQQQNDPAPAPAQNPQMPFGGMQQRPQFGYPYGNGAPGFSARPMPNQQMNMGMQPQGMQGGMMRQQQPMQQNYGFGRMQQQPQGYPYGGTQRPMDGYPQQFGQMQRGYGAPQMGNGMGPVSGSMYGAAANNQMAMQQRQDPPQQWAAANFPGGGPHMASTLQAPMQQQSPLSRLQRTSAPGMDGSQAGFARLGPPQY